MNQTEKAAVGYNVAQRVDIYSDNENHTPNTALCHLKNWVIIIEKITVEREPCQELRDLVLYRERFLRDICI
jgi:hypothetical protein